MDKKNLINQLQQFKKYISILEGKFTSNKEDYTYIGIYNDIKSNFSESGLDELEDIFLTLLNLHIDEDYASFKKYFSKGTAEAIWNADNFDTVLTNILMLVNYGIFTGEIEYKQYSNFEDSNERANDFQISESSIPFIHAELKKVEGIPIAKMSHTAINSTGDFKKYFDIVMHHSNDNSKDFELLNSVWADKNTKTLFIDDMKGMGIMIPVRPNFNFVNFPDDSPYSLLTYKDSEYNRRATDDIYEVMTEKSNTLQRESSALASIVQSDSKYFTLEVNVKTLIEQFATEYLLNFRKKSEYSSKDFEPTDEQEKDFVKYSDALNSFLKSKYISTNFELIFDKFKYERCMIDARQFYYACASILFFGEGVNNFISIALDKEQKYVYLISNYTQSHKIITGFDPKKNIPIYSDINKHLVARIPVIAEYTNITTEIWLHKYSILTPIKDIIEEEAIDVAPITIPAQFIGQKDLVSSSQMTNIGRAESVLKNSRLEADDFLRLVEKKVKEYILTYAKEVVIENRTFYEPRTDHPKFMAGTKINYDYIWKVNEVFWRYNKDLSVREMIGYFTSKADDYHYRLLSYRILGIDCHLFRDKLLIPLLREGIICVEDLRINITEKKIENPLKLSFFAEYITGNYYDKKKRLQQPEAEDITESGTLTFSESIIQYFGNEIGELILANQNTLLDKNKPTEMRLASTSEGTRLYFSFLDKKMLPFFDPSGDDSYDIESYIKKFRRYLSGAKLSSPSITSGELEEVYLYRYPHKRTIPKYFAEQFNCFNIQLIKKDHPKNKKKKEVFAVFGANDQELIEPYFISDSNTSQEECKDYINSNYNGGGLKFNYRKRFKAKRGCEETVEYAPFTKTCFTKALGAKGRGKCIYLPLNQNSYENLYYGKFITEDEFKNVKRIYDDYIKEGDADGYKALDDEEKIMISAENSEIIYFSLLSFYNAKHFTILQEGDKQLNYYLQTLPKDEQNKFEGAWNRVYNSYLYPIKKASQNFDDKIVETEKFDNSKFPMFVEHSRYFGRDIESELTINNNQIDGIKFHIGNKNSSLLAHEVGFGKTMTSILAISHGFLTGTMKRILLSTPNPVYPNFIKEISGEMGEQPVRGLLPHIRVSELKNAREKVFLEYNKKTFQQTSGIKTYTTKQITYIHKYKTDVMKSVNEYITKITAWIEFDKVQNFIEKLESFFDNGLGKDWKSEEYFKSIPQKIRDMANSKKAEFDEFMADKREQSKEKQDRFRERDEPDKVIKEQQELQKIEKRERVRREKELTTEIKFTISNTRYNIIDGMGYYNPEFLENYNIIVTSHQAFSQLRTLEMPNNDMDASQAIINGVKSKPILFDRMNIDAICVDEIHNFNEIFRKSKTQLFKIDNGKVEFKDPIYLGSQGGYEDSIIKYNVTGKPTSSNKLALYNIYKYIQNINKSRGLYNTMALSATPFVDDTYQMTSVFSFIREPLQPHEFYSAYTYQTWNYDMNDKGELILVASFSEFKNNLARNKYINSFAQFYVFDVNIERKRPNKYTYPYNCKEKGKSHYKINCDSSTYLDFSNEQFELQNRIGLWLADKITELEIVPVSENKIEKKDSSVDELVLESINELISEGNYEKAKENYDVYSLDDTSKTNELYKQVIEVKNKIEDYYKENKPEAGEDEDDEYEEDVETITIKTKGGEKTLKAQNYSLRLAVSPYMCLPKEQQEFENKLLPKLSGISGENLLKSAQTFIENSPKLYFSVQAIKSTIEHDKNSKELSVSKNPTGQIIYLNFQNFIYGGVAYNTHVLTQAYLQQSLELNNAFDEIINDENTDEEVKVKLSEIEIISGSYGSELRKQAIVQAFNAGRVKVLIGSSTIREGINLQGNKQISHGNSTIYVVTSDFAPMTSMQLEGRIWRQGNPLDNVRIAYILMKNSIDAFVYSKVNQKIRKVKTMLEAGIYDFNETQFTHDKNELLEILNTDTEAKLKAKWANKEKEINANAQRINHILSRVKKVNEKYDESINLYKTALPLFNELSKALEYVYIVRYITPNIKTERASIVEFAKNEKERMQTEADKKYETALKEYDKEKEKLKKAGKKDELDILEKPKKDDFRPNFDELNKLSGAKNEEKIKFLIDNTREKINRGELTTEEIKHIHKELLPDSSISEISQEFKKYYNNIDSSKGVWDISDEKEKMDIMNEIFAKYKFTDNDFTLSNVVSYRLALFLQQNPATKDTIVDYLLNNEEAQVLEVTRMNFHSNFKINILKSYYDNGVYELILNDYYAYFQTKSLTLADYDSVENYYQKELDKVIDEMRGKEKIVNKWRQEYEEYDDRLKKEREKLKTLREFVALEVDKFSMTNDLIYLRDKVTVTEKQKRFPVIK